MLGLKHWFQKMCIFTCCLNTSLLTETEKLSASYIMIQYKSKSLFSSLAFFPFLWWLDLFYTRNLTSTISVAFYVLKFKRREEVVLYIGIVWIVCFCCSFSQRWLGTCSTIGLQCLKVFVAVIQNLKKKILSHFVQTIF